MGSRLLAGAQGAFAVGRFVGAGLMHVVKPRAVLLCFLTLCVVLLAPCIGRGGDTGLGLLYGVFFFESIVFPTIVALGMRGLGRHTKRGAGCIIGGVAGGACVPPLMGAVADARDSTAAAMAVPVGFMAVAWTYALAVNVWPAYRDTVDAFGCVGEGAAKGGGEGAAAKGDEEAGVVGRKGE